MRIMDPKFNKPLTRSQILRSDLDRARQGYKDAKGAARGMTTPAERQAAMQQARQQFKTSRQDAYKTFRDSRRGVTPPPSVMIPDKPLISDGPIRSDDYRPAGPVRDYLPFASIPMKSNMDPTNTFPAPRPQETSVNSAMPSGSMPPAFQDMASMASGAVNPATGTTMKKGGKVSATKTSTVKTASKGRKCDW